MALIDPKLYEYATPRQAEYMQAIEAHGSGRKAAEALGVHHANVNRALEAAKAKAARSGYAPGHFKDGVAPGYAMGKVTVQRGADGNVERTWERQSPETGAQREAMREAYAAMAQDLPRRTLMAGPKGTETALCNLYTLTDCHVGMLAWHREGGADWDLQIAEETLTQCFERLVEASPQAETAIINQLGDWLHSDNLQGTTPLSGHIVDMDGRYSKMVGAAIRILRRIVDYALAKHGKVHLIVAEGNHDLAGSVWLRLMFAALYENEPRVTVNDSELPYYVYQHGQTMLAFHHGHLSKNASLPGLFAAQYARIWGETIKRYAHTGHRHHVEVKEHAGMTVCQHSTLAARDAYAARGGWFSERQITAYTYHDRYGQVGSVTVVPEMVG